MEQKDIDIYEILKDVEYGTELYTPMCGKVVLTCLTSSNEMIRTDKYTRIYRFDKNGRWEKEGEVMLFPSAEMRDWSKFFKKGDVLVSNDSDSHIIFKGFSKNDYTTFEGRHWISVSKKRYISCLNMRNVQDYHLEDNKDAAQTYINTIEKRLGGKLNLETLEIEKTQPEFKDGDIVMSDSGTIVLVRGISLTRKIYYHAYMCDEDIYINQVEGEFFSRISRIKRFATDSEKQQLFDALAKEGKRWDSEKKQIVDLKPAFEIGKLYVFNEDDEDGELTIIGKLIAKNESEDTLTFGNQYEIETEKFVTDQAFDLRISVNKELREATESEVELFNKHYAIWKKEKEARKQPAFKTFDKVLVRDEEENEWIPALFVRDRGEGANFRYEALSIHSGKTSGFSCCIPFEGNEHLAFTSDPF